MQAKELRIGNTIDAGNGEAAEILSIMEHTDSYGNTFIIRTTKGDCYLNEVNPIPITEEGLTRLGFKCDDNPPRKTSYPNGSVWRKGNYSLFNRDNLFWVSMQNTNSTHLQYVHELQNEYKKLEKKELNVT